MAADREPAAAAKAEPIARRLMTVPVSDGAGPKLLRLDGARRVTWLLDLSQGGGDAALSTDERWMANVALDAGTPYVFVSPYPDANASRILVTTAGGSQPLRSRDGRTLFYTHSTAG